MEGKLNRGLLIAGIVIFLLGTLDPLEGSVLIVPGSILMAVSSLYVRDRHRKVFTVSSVMIIVGVVAMFFLSSLGGFGCKSELSWWWGLLLIPYPAGWLLIIVTLLVRVFRKRNMKIHSFKTTG